MFSSFLAMAMAFRMSGWVGVECGEESGRGQLEEDLLERRHRARRTVGGDRGSVRALQAVERVVGDDATLRNDERLLADRRHLGKDVRREHDGVLAGERLDELADLDDLCGIEPDRGLVED